MKFGTKATTLEALRGALKSAVVPPSRVVSFADWRRDPESTVRDVAGAFPPGRALIVRSSASSEDGVERSLAGKFLSVPNVRDAAALREAIAAVFESYEALDDREHCFVQPMVERVALSGVAFGREPSTGSPYRVINYDESGATDGVTSGTGRCTRTLVLSKGSPVPPPARFAGICALLDELEALFGTDRLDLELAIDAGGTLHLLQVRPLVLAQECAVDEATLGARLAEVREKVAQWLEPKPFLLGSRTVFGVMPDWNPAEIIGVRPRPLALSLYTELVTDSTWAYQRDNYGYRNLRSQPLIQSLHGCPYVDVRVDFNSFVPADVPEPLATKLVEHYLDRLVESPHLHDKVEFEIIFSCWHFDLEKEIERLRGFGFTAEEIAQLVESLRALTVRIVDQHTGLWKKDLERIAILEERHRTLVSSSMSVVEKIYWLLEDCKRYGTLPFAGLARAGFIAVQMLESMVSAGILGASEAADFMASLDTISSRMARDHALLPRETFLSVYGHLRPGTYDVLSPRYDEAPDRYFDWSRAPEAPAAGSFRLAIDQYARIQAELERHRLDLDVLGLFEFLKRAIEGREYAKFLFTRNVSDALSLIKHLGREHGLGPEDLSYADVRAIQRLFGSCESPRAALLRSIEQGRQAHDVTRALVLPSLVFSPDDVHCFHVLEAEPNYVTHLSVEADVALLDGGSDDLGGKIVFIENADPGFDWIFTRGIAGFVTMYGGVNSHMAIRAAEMKIPAVVGAGESHYRAWSRAKRLLVDCCNRQVKILR